MGGVVALGVLGPLLLEGAAGPVRIGSARQRRLLAALAAHLGRSVDVLRLADLVWADDLPVDPAGAVQTNVARLRRVLPAALRLSTTPEGYRLDADRADVDVTAFADHLAAAATLDDPPRAAAVWKRRWRCGGGARTRSWTIPRWRPRSRGSPRCGPGRPSSTPRRCWP